MAAAAQPVPLAMTGELTRVDLVRRSVFVKMDGREPKELETATGAETRIVSRGRPWRLEDLRPGDRVVVAVIKVVGRAAIPSPSPSPVAANPFD
jgi:hypothetical protein